MEYFFKALQIMAVFTDWARKAMQDGKVSLREIIQLAERMAPILGLPIEYDIPGQGTTPETPPHGVK